jgi:hypothetical protein
MNRILGIQDHQTTLNIQPIRNNVEIIAILNIKAEKKKRRQKYASLLV